HRTHNQCVGSRTWSLVSRLSSFPRIGSNNLGGAMDLTDLGGTRPLVRRRGGNGFRVQPGFARRDLGRSLAGRTLVARCACANFRFGATAKISFTTFSCRVAETK